MRTSPLLLALPALATAQNQVPIVDQLKGWFKQATDSFNGAVSSASSAAPSAPSVGSIPNPVASGAAKFADANVQQITLANHKDILKPGSATASPGIEEWMVYVTGANKTCLGRCEHADNKWNEATALLAASPTCPNLAKLDCEQDPVLCNAWAMSPPTIMYIQLPQPLPDQSTPDSTVRSIYLNRTSVTATEIAGLHLQEKYKETEPYEGFWHPFDGPLVHFGLNIPLGYVLWGFSLVPSWAMMIGVSFLSRNIMSRRMPPAGGQGRAGAPPAGAAPAS